MCSALCEFLELEDLDNIFVNITEPFNNGEIEDCYDYLLNAPKEKIEESEMELADEETTTIITGSRGRENRRRITAKEIGQIVAEYKWEKGLDKNLFMEMLYRITGLRVGSLKDEIRYKDR